MAAKKRRYGSKAGSKVKKAMHERKKGTLRSGGSGKKVTSKKQAIAIGLSEARKSGAKVPKKGSSAKKRTAKKSTAKKRTARKSAPKRSAAKKRTAKKSAAKKRSSKK